MWLLKDEDERVAHEAYLRREAMSNLRSYQRVLLDMADECERELRELVRVDLEERGYSEGAREELNLRVKALRAGAEDLRDKP